VVVLGAWVRKCGIKAAIDKVCKCDVYTVDVLSSGAFEEPETRVVTETTQSRQAFKDYLETPVRYRAHLDLRVYLTDVYQA